MKNLIQKTLVWSVALIYVLGLLPNPVFAQTETSTDAFVSKLVGFFTNLNSSESAGFPVAEDRAPIKTTKFVFTSYNSLASQTDNSPCITANGYDVCKQFVLDGSYNTLATNILPIGTLVTIPELFGDKIFVVRDRMNKRYNDKNRADIWFPEYEQSKTFGVKQATLNVVAFANS